MNGGVMMKVYISIVGCLLLFSQIVNADQPFTVEGGIFTKQLQLGSSSSDSVTLVGMAISEIIECESTGKTVSCSTKDEDKGNWDMCFLTGLKIDMSDHNPEHIDCEVNPDTKNSGVWNITARVDNDVKKLSCKVMCLRWSTTQ